MHECPDCGQACACDGEDVWHEYGSDVDNCNHCLGRDCCDDEDDDWYPDDDDRFVVLPPPTGERET